MIPISVSDILKILDQIPVWKTLRELPKRVTELEQKVAALEEAAAKGKAAPTGRECPLCGTDMKVVQERPHRSFAFAGLKTHVLECPACGNKAERDFKPGQGYQ